MAMALQRHPTSPDATTQSSKKVPLLERKAAARVATLMDRKSSEKPGSVQIISPNGEQVELPMALADVMFRAAELLAEGRHVTVFPDEELMSTQDAAEILGVSRQYLVRLIDRGEIAAEMVGTHRRVRAKDIEDFKLVRDAKRNSALDRLTAFSEDLGGYDLGKKR
jgi:excisionase family DNA binding protein